MDILDAIARIERYAEKGHASFARDELVQTWIIHHLEIIGEAARNLSEGLRSRHPEIPWAEIVAMRNVLIHGYFGINIDRVWAVVQSDLPDLKRRIEALVPEAEQDA